MTTLVVLSVFVRAQTPRVLLANVYSQLLGQLHPTVHSRQQYRPRRWRSTQGTLSSKQRTSISFRKWDYGRRIIWVSLFI